ncbi:MAG: putative polysaccharide biosynthesis protein, partial [Sarcina sp.]
MKEQSTTKSFAILSIAGILAKLLSLLYVPVLTRVLGDEGMGMYFKVYDIFVFIYAVTNVGMQTAISKYIAELSAEGNYKDALRTFRLSRTLLLIVGSIFTFGMMVWADSIAKFTGNPQIAYGIMFLSPAVLITCVMATYKGYFQGRSQMKPVALAGIFEQIANIIFSIFFAVVLLNYGSKIGKEAELGSAGGTIGTSVGALIAVVYLVYVFYLFKVDKEAKERQVKGTKRIRTKKIIRVLISYGLPITLSAGLQNFGNLIDLVNVNSRLLVAGFSQVDADIMYGLLGKWRTLINIPMILITSLCVALLPALSRANVLKDRVEMKKQIMFALKTTYIIAIPAAVGLAILAEEVYLYMYGTTVGHGMMILGSITIVLMAVVFVQNIVLQSINKFYFVVYTLILGLIIKYISNYILVANPNIHIYGAIVGFILYFGVVLLLNNYKIKKVTKLKIRQTKLMSKPIIASIGMGAVIFILKEVCSNIFNTANFGTGLGLIYTSNLVIVGVIIYGLLLIIFKAITSEEIKAVSPKIYNRIP